MSSGLSGYVVMWDDPLRPGRNVSLPASCQIFWSLFPNAIWRGVYQNDRTCRIVCRLCYRSARIAVESPQLPRASFLKIPCAQAGAVAFPYLQLVAHRSGSLHERGTGTPVLGAHQKSHGSIPIASRIGAEYSAVHSALPRSRSRPDK
jgi:hypothetical protein